MDDNRFYTYVYLDPRKPGSYQCGDYSFEFEPFYIGKGFGDRYKRHLECLLNEKYDTYFYRKIKKIKKENLEPIILKVEENLTDRKSLDLEIWLIWAIGRSDLNLGPLTNLTDGGEGSAGYIYPEYLKKRYSEMYSGKNNPRYGKPLSEHTKKKISLSRVGKIVLHTEETKMKMSISRTGEKNHFYGKKHTSETKIKISNKLKCKNHPMYGKKQSKEQIEKRVLKNTGKIRSDEFKENCRIRMTGKTFSNETKSKMSEKRKGRLHSQESILKISISKLGKHHTEESKQKMRESRKRYYERLKLNIEQN